MRDDKQGQTGDDVKIEIADVRAPAGTADPLADAGPPLRPRLSPRRRVERATLLAGIVLLALVVVLAGNPIVRDAAAGLVNRLTATPTATLLPGADQYYLLPSPPDIAVRLDGHPVTGLRLVGTLESLRLTPGRHRLEWRPRSYPFLPLACVVSVPHAAGDTCPFVAADSLVRAALPAQGSIIGMHESLTTVVPAQYHPLLDAIQTALNGVQSSAVVQPGEFYFSDAILSGSPPAPATQPLHATLALALNLLVGYPEPCAAFDVPSNPQPCRFPGQDCQQLCTLPTSSAWTAGAMVQPVWTFTAADGQVVSQNPGDPFNLEAVVILHITWDGARWHVTPIISHTAGIPAADGLLCMAARDWLSQDGAWSFMVTNPLPPGAVAEYAAAPNPTDGCVVALNPHPGTGAPALFLQRFGVLLAANAAARLPGSTLPVAGAADQRLAQDLAAQYGL